MSDRDILHLRNEVRALRRERDNLVGATDWLLELAARQEAQIAALNAQVRLLEEKVRLAGWMA